MSVVSIDVRDASSLDVVMCIFCLACIQTALEHTHRCPKCNTPCSIAKDIFPNFTLNQIVERVKEETNTKKCKITQSVSCFL